MNMLILPLKFIREEDKKAVGINLYHLAKLGHSGLPVIESVVVIPSLGPFEKILNKYLKHNINIKNYLNNIKTELLNIPIPENLKEFEFINTSNKTVTTVSVITLWQNLLEKWVYEIMSKIEREEKNLFSMTSQLVVVSANFTSFGKGFFDESRNHVVIKVEEGKINMQTSSEIENIILQGNKKLLIPQVYYWGVEDGKIKIVKVTPFTQSLNEYESEKDKVIVSAQRNETNRTVKTATKIFLDYSGETLIQYNGDGAILNIRTLNQEKINDDVNKILKFDSTTKIIFNPGLELNYEQALEYAKVFLFFRNKKKLNCQIVFPEVFSVDEFMDLKRRFASLGIYSKGSLKIWKQFNTAADFINLGDYLNAGFDGALVNLDKISRIVSGVDGEIVLKEGRIDWLFAVEKFLKDMGLSKITKESKLVLIKGKLTQNEELLNYFIRSGVWGVIFDPGAAGNFREHIAFLEKQALRKIPSVKIQH